MVIDGDCVTCGGAGCWERWFCGVRAEARAGDADDVFETGSAATFCRFVSGLWSGGGASVWRLVALVQ